MPPHQKTAGLKPPQGREGSPQDGREGEMRLPKMLARDIQAEMIGEITLLTETLAKDKHPEMTKEMQFRLTR